jgi:cell division septation protein DedD
MVMALILCLLIFLKIVLVQADTGVATASIEKEVNQSAARKILSIRPVSSDKGLKVYIKADGEFKHYKAFRLLKPNRFVIDMNDVRSSVKQNTWFVSSPFVKKIRLGTSYTNRVRIIFDLFPVAELPCKLLPKGNRLVVAIGDASVSPTIRHKQKFKRIPNKTLIAEKAKTSQEAPKKATGNPAGAITAVEVNMDDLGAKLHIVADGEITRFDSFHLVDPERFVVDLLGVRSTVGKERLQFTNPLVKGARLVSATEDQLRVIFDLTPAAVVPRKIDSKRNQLVFFVESSPDLYAEKPEEKVNAKPLKTRGKKAKEMPPPDRVADEKPVVTTPLEKIILHVNSVENEAKADNEIQRLEKHGFNSFYQENEHSGERWFRVYLGPFNDEQEAANVGSKLQESGVISYYKLGTFDKNADIGDRIISLEKADINLAEAVNKKQKIYSTKNLSKSPHSSSKVDLDNALPVITQWKIILLVNLFADKARAEEEVQRLERHGYGPFYQEMGVARGKLYGVYLGTFNNEQEALKIGTELKGKKIIPYYKTKRTTLEMPGK